MPNLEDGELGCGPTARTMQAHCQVQGVCARICAPPQKQQPCCHPWMACAAHPHPPHPASFCHTLPEPRSLSQPAPPLSLHACQVRVALHRALMAARAPDAAYVAELMLCAAAPPPPSAPGPPLPPPALEAAPGGVSSGNGADGQPHLANASWFLHAGAFLVSEQLRLSL